MGTDYFIVDPVAKVVKYIDRAGIHFCHVTPWPERQEVEGWPYGPVRVITPEVLAATIQDLTDENEWDFYAGTRPAVRFCQERAIVLLIDDHSMDDELSHDFCHKVVFEGVEGWTGEDMLE